MDYFILVSFITFSLLFLYSFFCMFLVLELEIEDKNLEIGSIPALLVSVFILMTVKKIKEIIKIIIIKIQSIIFKNKGIK